MTSASEYNLPLHVRAASENPDDYGLENGYHHQDGVSPTGLGGWDGQGDGGGKFRLKRRRRCGQCGPCLVKENCNKCQYCMRKDVLKQACIYRKCVYLRKPVPRFRQDPPPLPPSLPSRSVSPITNGKPPPQQPPPSSLPHHHHHQQQQQQPPPPPHSQHHSQSAPPPLPHHHQQQPPSSQSSAPPPPPPQQPSNHSSIPPSSTSSANSNSALSSAGSNPSPLQHSSSSSSSSSIPPVGGGNQPPPPPNHHSSEYSSCRLNQSPFMAMQQPRGPVFESNGSGINSPTNSSSIGSVGATSTTHGGTTTNHSKSSDPLSRFGSSLAPVSSSLGPSLTPNPYSSSKLDQTTSPGINHHAADLNSAAAAAAAAAAVAAASPLNGMNSSGLSHHHHHPHHPHHHPHPHHAAASKGSAAASSLTGRDSYFSSMDPWNAMPYSFPRATPGAWSAGSSLTSPHHPHHAHHHAAAAAYSFQQPHTPFPASFTPSSCRLGLQDQAATNSHFSPTAGTHQHSFHAAAGMTSMTSFAPDLSAHATNSNLRPTVNPAAFYPTASHLPPATIPSFPSALSQFHSAAAAQTGFQASSYSMHPHHHMYPGGFYSSFRTPSEPQIYHAQIVLHQNPFKDLLNSVERDLSCFTTNKNKNYNNNLSKSVLVGYPENEILISDEKNKVGFSESMEDKLYFHLRGSSDKSNESFCFEDSKTKLFTDADGGDRVAMVNKDTDTTTCDVSKDDESENEFHNDLHIPSVWMSSSKSCNSAQVLFQKLWKKCMRSHHHHYVPDSSRMYANIMLTVNSSIASNRQELFLFAESRIIRFKMCGMDFMQNYSRKNMISRFRSKGHWLHIYEVYSTDRQQTLLCLIYFYK